MLVSDNGDQRQDQSGDWSKTMASPPGNGLSGLRNQDRSSGVLERERCVWIGRSLGGYARTENATLRAARGGPTHATCDEVTDEARRRLAGLPRVE